MQFYRHRFDTIEEYLHHRSPYLLVNKIVSIDDERIQTQKTVSLDEPCQGGHFPGAPIFPGALMQELVTQTAGILIAANYNPMDVYDTQDPNHNEYALGVLMQVNSARYKRFARPGDTLDIYVTLTQIVNPLFEFTGKILKNDSELMKIDFRLSNIKSSLLSEN